MPKRKAKPTLSYELLQLPFEKLELGTDFNAISPISTVLNASLTGLGSVPKATKPLLSVNRYFLSTAEPDALFDQNPPQLSAECSFENYVNCCMYFRRKQMLQELEWKRKVFGIFAEEAISVAKQFEFNALQRRVKERPLYGTIQEMQQIRNILYIQGQQLKNLQNDEAKAQQNERIRKAKVNYILTKTAKMCNKIADEMKTLETMEVPYFINTKVNTLRPYEVHGFKFLLACSNLGYNAILADDLGLGKSLQTICLLAALAERGIYGPHLVVVPSTLIYNWQNEFNKWFPAANVMVYYGTKPDREKQRNGWTYEDKFSILLTSYNTAVTDASILKRRHFYYLIMDEAHIIRNSSTRAWNVLLSFSCENKLLISGTPISNSAGDVWSLLHFVLPGFFASKTEFLELFARDVERMADGELGVSEKLVKSIHQLLRPFMLRRLKSEVENELPKKYEYIVPCPLTRKQLYLYNEFMYTDGSKNVRGYLQIVNVLTQLRKICNHPRMLEDSQVFSGFSMGEGVFEFSNEGYYEILDSYSKTDVELIYKKNIGWWNNFGTFMPRDLRETIRTRCDACKQVIERKLDVLRSICVKESVNAFVDLEQLYKTVVDEPRKARQLLTTTSGYEFTIDKNYCSNLLYVTEQERMIDSVEFCERCVKHSTQDENDQVLILAAAKERVEDYYLHFSGLSTQRNVHCFRDERMDVFHDKAAAFSVMSAFTNSYIYQQNTRDKFTFKKFCKELGESPGYTWQERCGKKVVTNMPDCLKTILYRRSLIYMLQQPFIDARLIKLLFDVSICYGISFQTYAMMREYCDTETMRQTCCLMTRLTEIWEESSIMQELSRCRFVRDRAFLSPALTCPCEKTLVGSIYLSNYFLDYFYKESYANVDHLREEFTIPYPNRYFYEPKNIEYYQFKCNIRYMRAYSPLHSMFYTPAKNYGLTRFLTYIWPTFNIFDGQSAEGHNGITVQKDSMEKRMASEIYLPHYSEIMDIDGLGGSIRMSYNEDKLEIQIKDKPSAPKKNQLIRNLKTVESRYASGQVLLHLSVPNIGYWSMVNAYISEQVIFRQPYCVLSIRAGHQCCCNPDEAISGNSYSFNEHTFNFRKLSPTELFSKYEMYRLSETAHPTDLDEVPNSLIVRPGTVSERDRFEVVNERLFGMERDYYMEAPNHSDLIQESGKLIVLRQLLKNLNDRGCKCLIFTQQTKMLDILEIFLTSLHYQYYRMDGNTQPKEREVLVDKFNAFSQIFCFIMTTRTGGIGLNLTGANSVIFVDCDWNPQVHEQATDRVHRINETREVEVYTLVSEYTVEENIVRRATQKKHLDKLIMRDGGFVPEFFENEDVFADKMHERFSQREKEIEMVYVSLVDDQEAGQRLGDVLDAFEDEDDQEAKRELLLEQRGDLEANSEEDSVQVVETGEQLMKQVEIYSALQNAPPVFLRFFEEGYRSIPDVILPVVDQVELFGFDENVGLESVTERKKMMYQTYQIDRGLFERTIKDLENYAATEMQDDVAKIEVSRTKAKVKKIEVQLKAKMVQVGSHAE